MDCCCSYCRYFVVLLFDIVSLRNEEHNAPLSVCGMTKYITGRIGLSGLTGAIVNITGR